MGTKENVEAVRQWFGVCSRRIGLNGGVGYASTTTTLGRMEALVADLEGREGEYILAFWGGHGYPRLTGLIKDLIEDAGGDEWLPSAQAIMYSGEFAELPITDAPDGLGAAYHAKYGVHNTPSPAVCSYYETNVVRERVVQCRAALAGLDELHRSFKESAASASRYCGPA